MRDDGVTPTRRTARQLASEQGWTVAHAEHVLDGLVDRGCATKTDDGEYLITGLGLGVGERMGVVKPLDLERGGWKI